MEGELILRLLKEEDLLDAVRLEELCFTDPWSCESLRKDILENPNATYLGAFYDGTMIGFGGIWVVMEEAFITTICIDPAFRGNGAGSFLLEVLMDTARSLGAEDMTLEVRVSNIPAQRLYTGHGFTSVGVRKRYYTDNGEDAYVMYCSLVIAP